MEVTEPPSIETSTSCMKHINQRKGNKPNKTPSLEEHSPVGKGIT
jgi:hypothetical protein